MNIIESNLKWNGALAYGNAPNKVILHHAEANGCTIYDIDRWHKERGWVGCGYHYFVTKDGLIYTGRPENAIGSHCLGYNSNSLGICAEGQYCIENMQDLQKNTLFYLIQYLCSKYNINRIYKHCDLNNTSCPGSNYPFEEILASLKGGNYGSGKPKVIQNQNRTWLQVGDTGDKVKELQQKLNRLGYSCSADGIYGKETKAQVYKFQIDNDISADGLAGVITFNTIAIILSKVLCGIGIKQPIATRYIQRRLSITPVDGIYGRITAGSVNKWQGINSLQQDGVFGINSWTKLIG